MASYRQVLKSLLSIAVFVLVVLLTTIVLFSTIWSTSEKCSTSCKRMSTGINNSRKAWSEDNNVSRAEDYPHESWAEIPEILYSFFDGQRFFSPPPPLSHEDTTPKCIHEDIVPPIAYVHHVFDHGKRKSYLGTGAVLVKKWVLTRSFYLKRELTNTSQIFVRLASLYSIKGGQVIRVAHIVYFKLLASLLLEHPVSSPCVQFAILLGDSDTNIYYRFYSTPPYVNKQLTIKSYVAANVSDERGHCAAIFSIPKNNTYILSGFLNCIGEKNKEILFKKDNGTYLKWIQSL